MAGRYNSHVDVQETFVIKGKKEWGVYWNQPHQSMLRNNQKIVFTHCHISPDISKHLFH